MDHKKKLRNHRLGQYEATKGIKGESFDTYLIVAGKGCFMISVRLVIH